jgi:hypothetical protein
MIKYVRWLTAFCVQRSQGGLTSGKRPVVKIIAESLSQHNENRPIPHSGIGVGE